MDRDYDGIERIYYIYILYWYDMHPKAEIRETDDGKQYATCIRESGEADPIAMPHIDKLKDIVKARTGRDDWTEIHTKGLWRLENFWIKRVILGWDLNTDEMEYDEDYFKLSNDGKTKTTWRKRD